MTRISLSIDDDGTVTTAGIHGVDSGAITAYRKGTHAWVSLGRADLHADSLDDLDAIGLAIRDAVADARADTEGAADEALMQAHALAELDDYYADRFAS